MGPVSNTPLRSATHHSELHLVTVSDTSTLFGLQVHRHKRCLGLAALANAKHPKHLPGNSGGSCQPPQRPHTECPHPRNNYCHKYHQNRGLFMTILVHRSVQKTRFTTNLESSSLLRGGNPVLNRHRHHIQKIRWNMILHEFHHVWHVLCMF